MSAAPSVLFETEPSILVESKEEPKVEQTAIKRRPMPEFLRKALEDRQQAWKEEEARKQVRRESRQRGHQMGYGRKDVPAAIEIV